MVRAFANGVTGHWIDPSWWTNWAISATDNNFVSKRRVRDRDRQTDRQTKNDNNLIILPLKITIMENIFSIKLKVILFQEKINSSC